MMETFYEMHKLVVTCDSEVVASEFSKQNGSELNIERKEVVTSF